MTDLRAFAIDIADITYWLVIDKNEILFCTVDDRKGDEAIYRRVRAILDGKLEYKEKKRLTIERPSCNESANIVHIYRFEDDKETKYGQIKKELAELKENL